MTKKPGQWSGDTFTAEDGRLFHIQTERVRGEGSWHSPRYYDPETRTWLSLLRLDSSLDGSYDKRTVRHAIERFVREHPV